MPVESLNTYKEIDIYIGNVLKTANKVNKKNQLADFVQDKLFS